MNVFISINGLRCGGAEKSLISFLNEIPEEYIKRNDLKIDLLVLDKKDHFFTDIPAWVNTLQTDDMIDGMFESSLEHIKNPVSIPILFAKILTKIRMKLIKEENVSNVQHIWNMWKNNIEVRDEEYDIAISYVDGFSNYYVIDKIKAKKKVLWVHNEYSKLNYKKEYDKKYFDEADAIITISDICVNSLQENFPENVDKIRMIPNISSPKNIWNLAEKERPKEYVGKNIIVSIGRLNIQKGFDMAIDAAKILSEKIDFSWYILGEGELREELEQRIRDCELQNKIHLIGNRSNPYPYIRYADVFVQPSRYEGKSIVLDEAKILEKPIVVTDYETVFDSIENDINGVIVGFNKEELANAIVNLFDDVKKRDRLVNALKNENEIKRTDIDKYLSLIEDLRYE
ncbi:glycosyltransferase [Pseudobutyrivibrio ruminis]|uniref:glycosyltransferase n=1 Tax=Pseudobutyrivibrio ruminis TaxID=46206 RepID=UPI00041ECFFD|nr:glycosyltransferase [Pseudobutyrivibrio ruminis]